MTVIAWDGETLAADRQVTIGTTKTASKKIDCVAVVTDDKISGYKIFGAAGVSPATELFMEWAAGNEEFPTGSVDLEGVVIFCSIQGNISVAYYQSSETPLILDGEHLAIGIGDQAALAAMMCDKTAKEAVLMTSLLVDGCGMGVDSISCDELLKDH